MVVFNQIVIFELEQRRVEHWYKRHGLINQVYHWYICQLQTHYMSTFYQDTSFSVSRANQEQDENKPMILCWLWLSLMVPFPSGNYCYAWVQSNSRLKTNKSSFEYLFWRIFWAFPLTSGPCFVSFHWLILAHAKTSANYNKINCQFQ